MFKIKFSKRISKKCGYNWPPVLILKRFLKIMRTEGALQTFEGTKCSMPLYSNTHDIVELRMHKPMMCNKERENNKPELKLHSSPSILVFLR